MLESFETIKGILQESLFKLGKANHPTLCTTVRADSPSTNLQGTEQHLLKKYIFLRKTKL